MLLLLLPIVVVVGVLVVPSCEVLEIVVDGVDVDEDEDEAEVVEPMDW